MLHQEFTDEGARAACGTKVAGGTTTPPATGARPLPCSSAA